MPPFQSIHKSRDFPDVPVVKTSPSHAGGAGLICGRGAKSPHASWQKKKKQNIKQKQYCDKFNKYFKNCPYRKKKILKKIFPESSTKVGFPGGSDGNESACNAGDLGSIPGLGRSPGEGNGNPLQYSSLENSMDRGAWQATVHGVTKSGTQLSN